MNKLGNEDRMRCFRIILLILMDCLLVSCGGPAQETGTQTRLFRHNDPAAALERISTALRSGNIIIRDRKGYSKVFGADSFRFRENNIRPAQLSFIPETSDFTCVALVMDSVSDDGQYDLLHFAGSMNPLQSPSLIGTETVTGTKNAPPQILPEPSVLAPVCEAMRRRIQTGEVSWDSDSSVRIPSEREIPPEKKETAKTVENMPGMVYFLEKEWWKDRLIAQKGSLRLTENDLALCRAAAAPGGTVTLTYCVTPLIVRTSGRTVSYATLEADLDRNGALLRTRKGGENSFEDALSVILYPFSREENDEIYKAVFNYLFKHSVAKTNGAAPREKARFLFVPETADPDFRIKYAWESDLAVRSPFERDWSLGIPFNEKAGRYTGFGNGEYYYSAGAIRPVDNTTAYVLASIFCLPPSGLTSEETAKYNTVPVLESATVRFNGPVGYLKLKKGFFGWYVERDLISPLAPPGKKQIGTTNTKS